MVTNSPGEHPKISKKELNYIERSLNGESESEVCIPLIQDLDSKPLLRLALCCCNGQVSTEVWKFIKRTYILWEFALIKQSRLNKAHVFDNYKNILLTFEVHVGPLNFKFQRLKSS